MKLQFDLGSTTFQLANLQKEMAGLTYKLSMGEQKVCLILPRHKDKMCQMVVESLDND